MIIALIITILIAGLFAWNYFRVRKELKNLGKLNYAQWNDLQLAKINHDKLKSIIQSRDLQIIELEKINLEYFKDIHNNCIKIETQENEITKLKKYGKGMRKLNKDMIRKYVALNNELEQLTKTAPIGNGN
jgi:hypothetical protein